MIDINISHTTEIWLFVGATVATILFGLKRWRIADRDRLQRARLDGFRGAVPMQAAGMSWYRRLGSSIAASPIVGTVEQQRLLKLLAAAGIRSRGNLANFIALKVCGALVLAGLVWIGVELGQLFVNVMLIRLGMLGIGFIVGWRLPDFVLNHMVKRRRLRLEAGMPDALDLLVICAESGLSLNQSIEEISKQLRASHKDVADEFTITSAEMQVVADFGQALDSMVERIGLSDLRSLVATLKQSIKFGTPLAESLRTIAAEMRATRQARYEQRAARLPVLLAIPMSMFILPCLLMIVGTPVVLRIMDVFKTFYIGIGSP
jgi:tight adherence protein C